jgi:hypothetical protein
MPARVAGESEKAARIASAIRFIANGDCRTGAARSGNLDAVKKRNCDYQPLPMPELSQLEEKRRRSNTKLRQTKVKMIHALKRLGTATPQPRTRHLRCDRSQQSMRCSMPNRLMMEMI